MHITSLEFTLQFISLLFYNSLSLYTFINTGSFAVDRGIGGWEDIFADVVFCSGLCGFVLAISAQEHTKHGGQSDLQQTSWREGPSKE